MIRVHARTRRSDSVPCDVCGTAIAAGDRYRERIAVQEDWMSRPFARLLAHDACVVSDPLWTVTTRAVLQRAASESLAGVRRLYGLDVEPGRRCTALGEPGEVVGGDGKYLRVRLDGHRHAANYHVRDVVFDGADQPSESP